jgi:hypothetical protein
MTEQLPVIITSCLVSFLAGLAFASIYLKKNISTTQPNLPTKEEKKEDIPQNDEESEEEEDDDEEDESDDEEVVHHKLVLVARQDLNMGKGKIAAQGIF